MKKNENVSIKTFEPTVSIIDNSKKKNIYLKLLGISIILLSSTIYVLLYMKVPFFNEVSKNSLAISIISLVGLLNLISYKMLNDINVDVSIQKILYKLSLDVKPNTKLKIGSRYIKFVLLSLVLIISNISLFTTFFFTGEVQIILSSVLTLTTLYFLSMKTINKFSIEG